MHEIWNRFPRQNHLMSKGFSNFERTSSKSCKFFKCSPVLHTNLAILCAKRPWNEFRFSWKISEMIQKRHERNFLEKNVREWVLSRSQNFSAPFDAVLNKTFFTFSKKTSAKLQISWQVTRGGEVNKSTRINRNNAPFKMCQL